MARELKATVVNMKDLSQNINDPIVVGAGDASGRVLRIIFTQEAAAQFTPSSKVYLSWKHQELDIKGYNVFTEIKNEDDEDWPPTWEIRYPQTMLHEGNVLACIQLVDDISIATSTNFMIHILADPNENTDYTATDDYSDFKKMIISISCLEQQMKDQMEAQKIEFEDMQLEFYRIESIAQNAEQIATEAKEIAENALEVSQNIFNTYEQLLTEVQETKEISQNAVDQALIAQQKADNSLERTIAAEQIALESKEAAENAVEQIELAVTTAEEAKEIAENATDYTPQIEQVKTDMKNYIEDLLLVTEF